MSTRQTAVRLAVEPWFADHSFDGKTVLPAVESMLLLAEAVSRLHAHVDVRCMEDVRFGKFLEIPPGSTELQVLVEDERLQDGSVEARLLSRVRYKALSRLTEHARVLFAARSRDRANPPAREEKLAEPVTEVSAEAVYRELVPFGPGYRTLQGTLYLGGNFARGQLLAPENKGRKSGRDMLGSPFPLDGAFHAACVLGQRFVDFVPFPVGFARRIINRPTRPGGSYTARVLLTSGVDGQLVFDLDIVDDQDQLCETVTGLHMRDVSGGRIKPPDWIRS